MVHAAAIYARISSDPEGDRLGVTRQTEDCQALAARKGWPVAEVYVDDDRSAYNGKPRPEYRRMLADVSDHRIDAVIVYNLDRLHRRNRELEGFFDTVDAAGLTNLASVEGDINLGSHDGRFHARIMGAVAQKASDDLSRRISRKNLERAQAGLPTGGGPRPFGYQLDRVHLDPGEAALVREASRRVLAGEAVRTIASEWNAAGIKTTTGRLWSVASLVHLLTNPRLSAQRVYRGEVIGPAQWEAILTPAETARLAAVIGERTRARMRPVRRYLLSRLLRCGLCDATLISRPQPGGTRRYVCAKGPMEAGCGRLAINAAPVEDFIARLVLLRLSSPDVGALLAGEAEAEALSTAEQANLAADRDRLDQLAADYGDGMFTRSEWFAARKKIEARIDVARKKINRLSRTAAIEPYIGKPDALRETWRTLTLNQQRAIVAALLDRALIRPALRGRATPVADRVEPVWRDG